MSVAIHGCGLREELIAQAIDANEHGDLFAKKEILGGTGKQTRILA